MFRHALLILVCCIPANAARDLAPPEPSFDTLLSYLGEKTDSTRFKEMVAQYGLKEIPHIKDGGGSLRTADSSFSFGYREHCITRVTVRIRHRPEKEGARDYHGELPCGLRGDETKAEILKRFGKPTYDDGHGRLSFTPFTTAYNLSVEFTDGKIGRVSVSRVTASKKK